MRSSENLTLRQRQLLYRAWHRGIREMDLILGRFADHEIESYDDAALDQFEILLEVTDKELFSWSKEVQDRGAGEILFTSMNHDGTKAGYANEALAILSETLSIPIIASGGAGEKEHFKEVFTAGKADAALAASVFHYNEIPIPELKRYLLNNQITVR